MPRYRFTAVDSYGSAHDGAIDAPTEAAARNKLASNGLSVRTVEEVAAAPGTEPPDVPRRVAPKPSSAPDGSAPPVRRPREFDPPAPAGRRGSPWPLVLSLLALAVSLATAAYTLTRRDRGPDANRFGKYNFATAEDALLSEVRMVAGGDVLAQLELRQKGMAAQFRERDETFQLDRSRTAAYQGKTILFFEYEQHGVKFKDVAIMERDDHGGWRRSYNTSFEEIEHADPRLFRKIVEWQGGRAPGWGRGPDGAP